jgi:acetolactate synthase small subunit
LKNDFVYLKRNKMKQTAVEWLFLKMENLITKAKVTDMDNNDFVIEKVKLLQQAKEMEKEQIINAFNYGQVDLGMEADEYYNNNFKSE